MLCWGCSNLYDVFKNIMEDEDEHVKVMTACRDYSIIDALAERKQRDGDTSPEETPEANMDRTQLT